MGTLTIDSDMYSGELSYLYLDSRVAVSVYNFTTLSTSIEFYLRDSLDADIVDLLESEVQIVDSINGIISIGNFNNTSASIGKYVCELLTPDVLSGTLSIIGTRYTGSGSYFIGDYTLIISLDTVYINRLNVYVTLDGTPITTLTEDNFSIVDIINSVAIASVNNLGDGNYTLVLFGVRMNGTVTVTNGTITGNNTY